MTIDLRTLLLVALIAFLAFRGCDRSPPAPGPEPGDLSPRESAAESLDQYGERLAEVYVAAATAIDTGEVASDTDLYRFTKITQAAREEAFRTFDAASEHSIPDGKWDRDQAAQAEQFCRQAAAGFRE